jgi:hypothetical protein
MPQDGSYLRVFCIAQGICVVTRVAPLAFGHHGTLGDSSTLNDGMVYCNIIVFLGIFGWSCTRLSLCDWWYCHLSPPLFPEEEYFCPPLRSVILVKAGTAASSTRPLIRHKFCPTAKELCIPYERPCNSLTEVSRALNAWSPAALVCRLDSNVLGAKR